MEKQNILEEKSYKLALKVVLLHKRHVQEFKEYDLGRQLLRAGTSIGANIAESVGGSSEKDLSNKLSISYRESRETKFWLRLLNDAEYISNEEFKELFEMTDELSRMLYSSVKTLGRFK